MTQQQQKIVRYGADIAAAGGYRLSASGPLPSGGGQGAVSVVVESGDASLAAFSARAAALDQSLFLATSVDQRPTTTPLGAGVRQAYVIPVIGDWPSGAEVDYLVRLGDGRSLTVAVYGGAASTNAAPDAAAVGFAADEIIATIGPVGAVASPTETLPSIAPSSPPSAVTGEHDVPALEAELPTHLDGETLLTSSYAGLHLLGLEALGSACQAQQNQALLTSIGRAYADLAIALAVPDSLRSEASANFTLSAIQIRGSEATTWQGWFFNPKPACGTVLPSKIVTRSIGGHRVLEGDIVHDNAVSLYEFTYAKSDTLFVVFSPADARDPATQALAEMP